jgi:hypothetical protein
MVLIIACVAAYLAALPQTLTQLPQTLIVAYVISAQTQLMDRRVIFLMLT